MATQPAAPALEITDSVYLLPLDTIAVGQRLRPIDPDWAEALGGIMRQDGQHTPIEVCLNPNKMSGRTWALVAGGHRLEGARLAGLAYVKAIIIKADDAETHMREVSENLWRRDLAPIERATFVAKLHELLKVRDGVDPARPGRAISADLRWQQAAKADAADANVTMTIAYGWTDEIAEKIGLSKETVFRDLALHRRLLPAVAEQLRGHPIAANAGQLRALAKLDPARQREAAGLIADGTAKNVSGALAILDQKTDKTPAEKSLNAFYGAWARMSYRDRVGALAKIQFEHADGQRAFAGYADWLARGRPELPLEAPSARS